MVLWRAFWYNREISPSLHVRPKRRLSDNPTTKNVEKEEIFMKTETIILNNARNVALTAYTQDAGGEFRYVARRPALLVLPGGGYQYCSAREADPVAFPFLKAGYQVFILHYSVGEDAVWPHPLEDYEQAMELIRSRADAWALYPDKIAVLGFSAGGHLAACAASMSRNRPNAALLGYAVTIGSAVRECNPTMPDVISAVDAKTCPCFLFATRDDNVVPIENSLEMMGALAKAGVAFESHIYAYGPHGFSTGDSSVQAADSGLCPRAPGWVADAVGWLRDVLGEFGPEGLEPPVCKAHVNGDQEAFLSADCTIGRLLDNPQAAALLEPVFAQFREEGGVISEFVRRMKLRDAMAFRHVPEETVREIGERLAGIPNT